jgi:flavin reductase (DIM6/NTAB) family NADH-FMN oxidoreductase RutF
MSLLMGSDHPEFDRLVAQLDYPMFIVTASDGRRKAGCLIGFASQVSIEPPRFLAGLSVKNHTFRVASGAEVLVVHLVPQEAEELAELFGGETGDDTDKFAQCQWRQGPGGAPVLTDVESWFAGRILGRSEFGDHVGFLLEPIAGQAGCSTSPLTFRRAKGIHPGHEA